MDWNPSRAVGMRSKNGPNRQRMPVNYRYKPAPLWQFYSRLWNESQWRQNGYRMGMSEASRERITRRMAGSVGCGGGAAAPPAPFSPPPRARGGGGGLGRGSADCH